MSSLDLDNPTDEQRLAVELLERAWRERDSALARVKDLEMLLGYSREGVKIWTEAHEHCCNRIGQLRAALDEALREWESYREDQRTSSMPLEEPRIVELRKLLADT